MHAILRIKQAGHLGRTLMQFIVAPKTTFDRICELKDANTKIPPRKTGFKIKVRKSCLESSLKLKSEKRRLGILEASDKSSGENAAGCY